MRLVVEVPDKQLERFRAAVEAENRTQAEVIRAAIDQYIRDRAKNGSTAQSDRPGTKDDVNGADQ